MSSLNAPDIKTSCYHCKTSSGESLVLHFVLGYQTEGALQVFDGERTLSIQQGSFWLAIKNKLARFAKTPSPGSAYRAMSITFPDQALLNFGHEFNMISEKKTPSPPIIVLKEHPLLRNFFDALKMYQQLPDDNTDPLIQLKIKEALIVLLKCQPELKDVLFDFSEPHKTDLAAFMETNFQFNLPLSQFAYLTGRSLSGFKRDFEKHYQTPPSKWLMQKRLEKAHFLLSEKKMKVADVYYEVGFEDVSHFSFSFKKQYGISPSALQKEKLRA